MLKGHRHGSHLKHVLPRRATKRLQFEFPVTAIHSLHELAALTGEPRLAGVLQDALKVYAWILTEQ